MEAEETITSDFTMTGTSPDLTYTPNDVLKKVGSDLTADNQAVDGRGNPTTVTLYVYFSRNSTSPYVADSSLFDSGTQSVRVSTGAGAWVGQIAQNARTDGDYALWAHDYPPSSPVADTGGRNIKVHVGS